MVLRFSVLFEGLFVDYKELTQYDSWMTINMVKYAQLRVEMDCKIISSSSQDLSSTSDVLGS